MKLSIGAISSILAISSLYSAEAAVIPNVTVSHGSPSLSVYSTPTPTNLNAINLTSINTSTELPTVSHSLSGMEITGIIIGAVTGGALLFKTVEIIVNRQGNSSLRT